MSAGLDDDVRGIDISINDIFGVKVVQGCGDGGQEVLQDALGDSSKLEHNFLKSLTDYVLDEEVEVIFILLAFVKATNIGTVQTIHYFLLSFDQSRLHR
jgi:hypothetical protein